MNKFKILLVLSLAQFAAVASEQPHAEQSPLLRAAIIKSEWHARVSAALEGLPEDIQKYVYALLNGLTADELQQGNGGALLNVITVFKQHLASSAVSDEPVEHKKSELKD